ncbi:DUF1538 domain-containing protein [Methanosarcina mazei]|jgi:hypothetical protein|uniref:DUF1538 domain-containing protein n=3 Tax=Methanosarcina mazei TaxID=2209 RepID=A0A0E3LTI3_METMZ|nr:DUF1538 domain-containing protein [Methanosarcina mazei]AAM30627.1 hypothetical protein MM_0931 [Methanosarcina mazei Go1]AKB63571.1 Protein of unknown function DUF1538 [Methanosarcina mazei S-6]AKB66929.1 Protein of unknown function DUF1538 [Methanosarcina mazei LYC]MDY0246938.1 DUF1538 domain-containing protein [Methanosarcina mazei]WIM44174.1 DUF1538 domain-containing protein [Methanosarcina mazei]
MSGSTEGILSVVVEVSQALIPLVIFFIVFQRLYLKLPRSQLVKLFTGIFFTAIGMILFLYGVYNGFFPIGTEIGEFFGGSDKKSLLIPIGFVLGFLATFAEPAVRVLCYQIEESSSGYISSKLMLYTLSSGVAVFVSIAMAKLVYGIPFLYIIVPGYLLVLVLLWLCDKDFIAIAFDSGGVATGPMAVTFLMSMAVGVASAQEGGNPLVDGFGLIAMIALAPIIFVMLLGVYIRFKGGINNVE